MDTAVPGRYPRPVQLVLAGLGVAIGWMLLSVVLGLSSSSALADETQDSGGLLGAVSTVAEGGTQAVGAVAQPVADTAGDVVGGGTATVEKVAEPVTGTVDTVAEPVNSTAATAAEPATVEKVAAPVSTTVTRVAGPATDTAGSVVGGAVDAVEEVAAPVTEPVLDAIGEPVGEIASGGASVVDDAVGALTGSVGTAVDGVTDTAGDLSDASPLQPIVSPVAGVASSALDTVGDAVEAVGDKGPVSGVVDVVTDVVEHTPIVGEVAEELGVPDAVEQVGGSLDGGVGSVGEIIGESGENIVPAAPMPVFPGIRPPLSSDRPESVSSPAPPTPIVDVAYLQTYERGAAGTATVAASGILQLVQRLMAASTASMGAAMPPTVATDSGDATTIAAATTERGGPFHSPGGVLPGDATAAASGGAGFGAWGLIAFGPLFAYRAWMRRAGPDDDRLPGAPIYDTDSSPD